MPSNQSMQQHTSQALDLVADLLLAGPRIAAEKKQIDTNVSDVMECAIDLATEFKGDARRRYWFKLMEAARREYQRETQGKATPAEDWKIGGVRDAEEREDERRQADALRLEQNNGFDAEHLDVQPEDRQ